ncbi:MAG: hypothetical protein K2Y26_06250 [Gemmatimonadaceae bacterium]|uniref:hypothetical protein n=1 Tax=Gemmatimonas sp. UBA7669 TaxID=1946568 RepID=UPI0025C1DE67|nr:hypothetical protein [Gemmatimonas sp. UBA7669]MBA3917569.1 hypothetical protein [Gemmatimonas sp.]MBX9855104.1 hypothetical protein [Gemmatimonadaceae bacterium]
MILPDGFAVWQQPRSLEYTMTPLQVAAARGPQYRAALFLLTRSPVFQRRGDHWVVPYLPNGGGIDFPRLLARADWSTGERLMVEAAASVFGCRPDGNSTVSVNLLDLRSGLDEPNRRAVYHGIELSL